MRVFFPTEPGGTNMTYMEVPDDFTNEQIAALIDLEWEMDNKPDEEVHKLDT